MAYLVGYTADMAKITLAAISTQINDLTKIVGSMAIDITTLKSDVSAIKETLQEQCSTITRIDKRLDSMADTVTTNHTNHEQRIRKLESFHNIAIV